MNSLQAFFIGGSIGALFTYAFLTTALLIRKYLDEKKEKTVPESSGKKDKELLRAKAIRNAKKRLASKEVTWL